MDQRPSLLRNALTIGVVAVATYVALYVLTTELGEARRLTRPRRSWQLAIELTRVEPRPYRPRGTV